MATEQTPQDHAVIYLSPKCACDDRTWCTEDQGPCEECGTPWTKYVLANQTVVCCDSARYDRGECIGADCPRAEGN